MQLPTQLLFGSPSVIGSEAQCVVKCCVSVQGTKDQLPCGKGVRVGSGRQARLMEIGPSASNLASRFRFSQAE